MIVEIDPIGNMTISAATAIEQYALRKFWEDWQAHKVTLGINVPDDVGVSTQKILTSDVPESP